MHQDVRADNAIVDLDSGIGTLVDWSFACAGAAWLDRARLAADIVCTVHADGSDAALKAASSIRDAINEQGIMFVAALAGMWRLRSTLPPIASLPTYRQWQLSRSIAVRPLLESRL